MQRLTKVSISNFRSCREIINLELADFTPLVGYNNAGKSNILAAIQWVLRKSTLSASDFFNRSQPVWVSATISGLTVDLLDQLGPTHRQKIERYVCSDRLEVRREQETPETKAAGVKLSVRDPDGEGEAAWVPNPTGIDNAVSALFPEPIQIGAMEDAGKDIGKFESGSTIGKLVGRLMAEVKETEGHRIATQLEALRKLLDADGPDRAPELARFDDAANAIVGDFFPGVTVKVHVPAPEIAAVFKSGTIKVYEPREDNATDGRDVSSMGHGAQRAIQMALVRQLAEAGTRDGLGRTLLLVDEPELYMHPQAIAKVRTALRKLSQTDYQVVFTTHSPLMIGRDDLANTSVVYKTEEAATMIRNRLGTAIEALEATARPQFDELFSIDGACQILFSDRVVLCEGKTEQELLPDIFETHHLVAPADKRVGIVAARGSGSIPKCLAVLKAMGINAGAVVDLDFAFKHAVSAGMLEESDPDLAACKRLFAEIVKSEGDAEIGGDGCFKAKAGRDKSSVARCYKKVGAHRDANAPIGNIAAKLRGRGVWLWMRGSIETHLGLTEKNAAAWSRHRTNMQARGFDACADAGGVRSCAEWMAGGH